jgi:hypothetical protein
MISLLESEDLAGCLFSGGYPAAVRARILGSIVFTVESAPF